MSADRRSFTLIVPVYNEAPHLATNLGELHDHLGSLSARFDWEMLIVDDGSTDGSGDIVDAFAAERAHVRAIHHPRNFRLGQALRFAFPQCTTDYIVTFDVDLSYSPDHIDRLLDVIDTTPAKVVVASPYMPGGRASGIPRFRLLTSRGANRLLQMASKSGVHTVTGLVRAYDRRFLSTLNLKAMDNEINAEILYKTEVMRGYIREIPAHLDWTALGDRRPTGMRFRRITAGFAFAGFLFRPYMYFIIPGALVALFSFVVAILAFGDFWTWKWTPWLAVISALVAAQLLTVGILSAQQKRYFEELFHSATMLRRAVTSEQSSRHPDDATDH